MELFKVFVDLVKAVAWPTAIFALGFMFRSDVRALFPRLKKAGPTGLEFDPSRQLLSAVTRELQELPGFPPRTPTIAKVETQLHAELGIIDPEKQIDVLVRNLAVARLARNFEQIYRIIFGSQIAGLAALAAAPDGEAPVSESSSYFDGIKAKYSEFYEKNTFEEWIRYPINADLVVRSGDCLKVTDLGRDFLTYLGETKLPAEKPW
jgi:hypothetical protein